jgi:hypothetical protein
LYKAAPFCELGLPQTSVGSGKHYIASMANGEHDEPPWME